MAYLLIDGYNVTGTAHNDLEKARNDLISALSEYSKIKAHHLTVVFDGWKDGKAEETITWVGGVRVIYSRLAEKADSVIMRIILKEKKPWIVISSDREIADFALKHDLVPITADEFEERLYHTLKPKGWQDEMAMEYEEYDDEDDYTHYRRKGNPKRMSKRQKKKLQALRKL
jgi:hypothetical protein